MICNFVIDTRDDEIWYKQYEIKLPNHIGFETGGIIFFDDVYGFVDKN